MRRRLNYTGRAKILEKDVRISVMSPDPITKQFTADLDLKSYNLNPNAPVWVEAYDRYTLLRFPFGVVSNPRSEKACSINEFANSEAFHFRVKVVDPENQNILLGIAKNINPSSAHDENQPVQSLLRLSRADLRGRPWKLEFPSGQYPILYIDQSIDAGTSLATLDIFFQGAVFPQILETILQEICFEDGFVLSEEIDPEDEWKHAWISFVQSMRGMAKLEPDMLANEDTLNTWIGDAIESFSRSFNAIKKIRIALKEIDT